MPSDREPMMYLLSHQRDLLFLIDIAFQIDCRAMGITVFSIIPCVQGTDIDFFLQESMQSQMDIQGIIPFVSLGFRVYMLRSRLERITKN